MLVQKNVQLNEVNLKKFYLHFPGENLSWALDLLLEKFVSQYHRTPAEYAEAAAQELKDEISK